MKQLFLDTTFNEIDKTQIALIERFISNYIKKETYFSKNLKKKLVPDNGVVKSTSIIMKCHAKVFNAFDVSEDIVNKLCLAGFLYFTRMRRIDNLVDSIDTYSNSQDLINIKSLTQKKESKELIINQKVESKSVNEDKIKVRFGAVTELVGGQVIYDEVLKILHELFPSKSFFWKKWNDRRAQFIEGFYLDYIDEWDIENFQYSKYIHFSNCKSAPTFNIIDALYECSTLPNKDEIYKVLNETNNLLNEAMQIEDDIKDFIEDFENKQFNLLFHHLSKEELLHNDINHIRNEVKPQLHLNDIISNYYLKIANLYDTGLEKTLDLDLPFLKTLFKKKKEEYIKKYLNEKGYILHHKKTNILSNKQIENNTLDQAIQEGLDFIFKEQASEGCWNDYLNLAGTSNVWTTSFVLSCIKKGCPTQYKPNIEKAFLFLNKVQQKRGWGYNSFWVPDNDSTSFVLIAKILFNQENETDTGLMKSIVSYQNTDGGYGTYIEEKDIISSVFPKGVKRNKENTKGWLMSHFDVSAVRLYLYAISKNADQQSLNKLTTYVQRKIENKEFYSFWWTDFVYTLYYLFKASIYLKEDTIQSFVKNYIEENYSFNKLTTSFKSNNFYMGMLLGIYCEDEGFYYKNKKNAQLIASQLISTQYEDGSWESTPSLRIFKPSIINPQEHLLDPVKDISTSRIDKLFVDYNRLFTSSKCYESLQHYKEVCEKTGIIF